MDHLAKSKPALSRRLFIFFGSLIFLYPLIRFINHRIPKKPVLLKIHEPLNSGGFLIKNDFIIFSNDERTWAISRKCTHLGCKLTYKENENILECPCHQSKFKTTGEVINGPAKKTLTTYKTEKQLDPPSFTVII